MTFLQHLKEEDNKTQGWNGANGFNSTLSANLDLYTRAGTMRFADKEDITTLFYKAYGEDPVLAIKNLFYIRDIEKGMGERRVFDVIIEDLAEYKPHIFSSVVKLIPHYGSFADIRKIIGNENLNEETVFPATQLLAKQLEMDTMCARKGEQFSLAAKWSPSVGSKNKAHKVALSRLLKVLGVSEKDYRKAITALRAKINLVETKLTEKKTSEIDYSKVPSQAFKKYSGAFMRNDERRFEEFLDKANEGEVKVNSKTLHVHQLVSKYMDWNPSLDKAIEAQWKNLPKLENTKPNVLPMVDVSGSMTGTPMEVAIALGIYLSENTEGEFRNHFLTFDTHPTLVSLNEGDSLYTKVKETMQAPWGGSTNLEAALQMVLNTAARNNLSQEQLPDIIPVFTDMQVDGSTWYGGGGADLSFYESMKQKFESFSYQIPTLLWWNISDHSSGAMPVTAYENNVLTVSGFSQTVLNNIFNLDLDGLANYTPENAMKEVLNGERYNLIHEALL